MQGGTAFCGLFDCLLIVNNVLAFYLERWGIRKGGGVSCNANCTSTLCLCKMWSMKAGTKL